MSCNLPASPFFLSSPFVAISNPVFLVLCDVEFGRRRVLNKVVGQLNLCEQDFRKKKC